MGIEPEFSQTGDILFHESEGLFFLGNLIDNLFLLSTTDQTIQPFMGDLELGISGHFFVSPDGSHLAFRHETKTENGYAHDLIVTNSLDQGRITIPWDEESWGGLRGWLANGQQLMVSQQTDPTTARLDDVYLVNPFTLKEQHVFPTFSSSAQAGLLSYAWGSIGMSALYDPTFTRVVYLEDNQTMVFWDLENEQELWRFIEPNLMYWEVPTWSPLGNYLALVVFLGDVEPSEFGPGEGDAFQILITDRDGKEYWRSDPHLFYEDWLRSMDSMAWSPDERYLSYLWKAPEGEDTRLYLFDTVAMHTLDFCLENTMSQPVWSPDSTQFIVWASGPDEPNGEPGFNNLIVDINKGAVIQVKGITFRPVAWLRSGP